MFYSVNKRNIIRRVQMKLASQLKINAPAERVWKVVAHDFAQVGEWASGVAHSKANKNVPTPEGATVGGRVCNVPGFGTVTETFTSYDEVGKTYTFEATGLPFFVTKAFNSWRVRAVDANTTEVSFQAEMHLMPILGSLMAIPMKRQLTRLLDNATEELKYYMETGSIHPRKQKLSANAPQAAPSN
jgi:carbon monoxide dehydrogenase subunit G